jgi:two-component system, NtrC family, response regulator AtoC
MRILIVDDEKPIVKVLAAFLGDLDYTVQFAHTTIAGREMAASFKPEIVLLDIYLPDGSGLDLLQHFKTKFPAAAVVMVTGVGDVKTAVEAMRAGAEDYLTKPLDLDELQLVLKRVEEKLGLRQKVETLEHHLQEQYTREYLFLSDESMRQVYAQIERVAKQDRVTTLILGETGTGKAHVAKLVHVLSSRTSKPFLELHCGAMPETLLESELFGHEAGAYTDARKTKVGLMEMAQGGSLFLDEVGELPLSIQVKLLKVLEQKTMRRLGGLQEIKLDVRVIAATNRDLSKAVKAGTFRSDLYYRLNVFPIQLPNLRSRPYDVLELAQFFFKEACRDFDKLLEPLSKGVLDLLKNYPWPGNVRELKNAINRMVINSSGNQIQVSDVPLEIREQKPSGVSSGAFPSVFSHDEAEKENIRQVLLATEFNKSKAAKKLGISRNTLLSKIKKYGLG